jgi:hypothetical protein
MPRSQKLGARPEAPAFKYDENQLAIVRDNPFTLTPEQREIRKLIALESIANFLAMAVVRLDSIDEGIQAIE